MSAPEFLIQATQGWARLYGDSHLVSTGVRFVLLANGLLIQRAERLASTLPAREWLQFKVSAVASVVLWLAVVLASTILGGS